MRSGDCDVIATGKTTFRSEHFFQLTRETVMEHEDPNRLEGGEVAPTAPVALSHDIQEPRQARGHFPPEGATVVKNYAELRELFDAFAAGLISLLAIVARPGLGKSQLIQQAMKNQKAVVIKLRKSPLDFYTDLYAGKDLPVVLDDADNLMSQPLCREYVKVLAETDSYKRLGYGTKTKILEQEGVPKFFYTTSPVCLIVNNWKSSDPIFQALESRAEFIYFDPCWCEVYREVGTWFWDQEIYDYLQKRLPDLREPDMRLFVKAHNRKKAGLSTMDWRKLIDNYVDDPLGLVVRRLLDDKTYESNDARAKAFCEETKKHRATFYRRLAQIIRYRPQAAQGKIILQRTAPIIEPRPADGAVPGSETATATGSDAVIPEKQNASATKSGKRSRSKNGQAARAGGARKSSKSDAPWVQEQLAQRSTLRTNEPDVPNDGPSSLPAEAGAKSDIETGTQTNVTADAQPTEVATLDTTPAK